MAAQRSVKTNSLVDNANVYASQLKQMQALRDGVAGTLPGMNELARATGGFTVETVNTTSAVDKMTAGLLKQKVSLSAAVKDWEGFKTTLNGVIAQQTALQKSSVLQTMGTNGKMQTQLLMPTGVTADMADAETRMSVLLNTAKAMGQSVQDWGKNMQWAGRQITAGFTMPLALAGAGLAKLAYDTDTELTKIVKMYSSTSESIADGAQREAAKEQELNQLRTVSFQNAINMSKQYGENIKDTLETESYWASQGYKGQNLMDVTNQVVQTSTVGSISGSDATNLVQSVMAAYKILPSQLQPAMDFLNALKNSTNLTMQDFADSIPKVGATISNIVPDSNKALQQTGILLTAMKEGGVAATEGANALKTAVARAADPVPKAIKYFDTLKDSVSGAMGIDVKKISADSGGNILDFMTELSKHTVGLTPDQLEIGMKDLFGIQQSNRMMVLAQQLQKAQTDPAHSQVKKAMDVAASGQDAWADVRTQEVTQFQQSASGQLKIAAETIKGQLTEIGLPILKGLTPVVNVLKDIVTGFQAIPGPIKSAAGVVALFVAAAGPLGMMAGIFGNFTGMITKVVASIGLLGNSTKILTKEEQAENLLQESSLQTKDAQLQATSDLALRMRELVTIMKDMIGMRDQLTNAEKNSTKAEEAAADAVGQVATAEKVAADKAKINVEQVLAQVTAYNELADAAVKAKAVTEGISYGQVGVPTAANPNLYRSNASSADWNMNAGGEFHDPVTGVAYKDVNGYQQVLNRQIALAATNSGIDAATIAAAAGAGQGPHGPLPYGSAGRAGGFAVAGDGSAAYDAGALSSAANASQASARRKAAQAALDKAAEGVTAAEVRMFAMGTDGLEEVAATTSAKFRVEVAQANAAFLAQIEELGASEVGAVLGDATAGLSSGRPNYIRNAQGGIEAAGTTALGPTAPVVGTARRSTADAQAEERAAEQAAQAEANIANQSEKTKMNWGAIAGHMMGVGLAAMSFEQMNKDSGSVASKLGDAAGVIMGLSMSGLPQLIKSLGTEGSKLSTVFTGMAGTLGTMWTNFKSMGVNALSAIGSSFKAMFTTPLGIGLMLLAGTAVAIYAIARAQTQVLRDQEQINKSTQDWASLLGYTSKQQQGLFSADGAAGTNGLSAYSARQVAVEKLTQANSGLVNALGKAKQAQDNNNSVFNLSMNEALKVKVDGGTSTQAKEAFDVALQAAGLNAAEIQTLDLKYSKINLDDPGQLKDQLNNQISQALNDVDGTGMQPGFGGFIGGHIASIFDSSVDNELNDKTLAGISKLANNTWDAFNNAISNNDGGGLDSSGKAMEDALNSKLQNLFDQIRGDGKNAQLFQRLGIQTATQLQDAITKAWADNASGKKLTVDEQSLVDIGSTGQFTQLNDVIATSLDDIGKAAGLSGPQLDDFKSKVRSIPALAPYFQSQITAMGGSMQTLAQQAQQAGSELKTALDEIGAKGDDAMGLTTQDATGVTNAIKKTFQDAQSESASYAQEIFSQQEQAAAQSIQNSAKKREQAMQDATKRRDQDYSNQEKAMTAANDAENKAITEKYKNLGKSYDAQIKQAQDGAKAQTDAISNQIKALQKEDNVRQQLFDNEKTRLQRLAAMQNNNIDFNSALNSGNLDEAARVYSKNASEVQTNALSDQQKALDDQSKAREDAMQAQIDSINAQRDAYVASVQTQKDALSDLQQAETDAAKARQTAASDALTKEKQDYDDARAAALQADQDKTQSAVTNSNNQYAAKKRSLDLEIAAITATIPATQAQYDAQIAQIEAAYAKYGVNLKTSGSDWAGYVGNALQTSVQTQAAALQSDIGWADIGKFIQDQIASGSGATIGQVVNFLKTGTWDVSQSPKAQPWRTPDQKTNAIQNSGITRGSVAGANHIGGFAGANGLTQRSREGVPVNAPLYQSEYMTILKQGEFVVNKAASERYAPLLKSINEGSLYNGQTILARHTGGPVDSSFGPTIGGAMNGMVAMTEMAMAGATIKAAKQGIAQAIQNKLDAQDAAIFNMTGGNIAKMKHSAADTIGFGRSQQGKPYIWGGAGPAGQDCSGFMSVLYNYMVGNSPGGGAFPWGRDWVTASFAEGRNFGPWVRTGRADSNHMFRIGVNPGSHMAGTLNGINVESGSGHGPMVGGKALGAGDKSFPFQYYLPAADVPQLKVGGTIQYDNTLANLHKGETVLTAPLTQALQDNVANGLGNQYHVTIDMSGSQFDSQIDFEAGVLNAMQKLDKKNGRNRTIS